jgi:5'-phosphate synthase pdxT subunit
VTPSRDPFTHSGFAQRTASRSFVQGERVGVLALQGGFQAHLEALGGRGVEVRLPKHLDGLDALVLPGGESTTQGMLIHRAGLRGALEDFVRSGKPVLATCAGLILCARYGWLDVDVQRNAYGRQLDSFEALSDDGAHHLVFIRAPRITRTGHKVEVLATLNGEPVLVRQGKLTGATFHPELVRSAPTPAPEEAAACR